MPLIEPRYRWIFVALFGVFMVFGTSMTIIGATLPKILSSFGWSYVVAGMVLGANAVAYFSFTFIGGYLVKIFGPKRTILGGLTINAIGLAFFAATPDPLVNILLSGFMGIGAGFVEISVNWTTLRLDTAKTGRPMNLMHGAFAVGAISGPLALGALVHGGFDWVTIYRCMSGVFAALALFILFMPHSLCRNRCRRRGDGRSRAAQPPIRPIGCRSWPCSSMSGSSWVCRTGWPSISLPSSIIRPARARCWSRCSGSGCWRAGLACRCSITGNGRMWCCSSFSALATVSIAALSLLGFLPIGPMTLPIGLGLVFLSGLGCSIFYPAVITLLGNCFPQAQSQAIGFAATGGGIGAFLFPFLMSALSQGWGLRVGFATYAVFGVAMTLAALGLSLAARRR